MGAVDGSGVSVATNPKGPGAAAVNIFTNPVGVFDNARPPILGIDARDGGAGPISGLGYVNLDMSVKKEVIVFERFNLEATGVFLNFLNHNDFANPSLSLQSTPNFGFTKSQGSSPRQIQMGIRASF